MSSELKIVLSDLDYLRRNVDGISNKVQDIGMSEHFDKGDMKVLADIFQEITDDLNAAMDILAMIGGDYENN